MKCYLNITPNKTILSSTTNGHLEQDPPPEVEALYGLDPVHQVCDGPQADPTHEVISILDLYEVVDDRNAVARGEDWW